MTNVLLYLLRQPEVKASLVLFFSILILPLSAFSVFFVPHSIWLLIRSSYIYVGLYAIGICFLARFFARGKQFNALHKKNLSGKTYLITGSAGGIGKQTALELAKRGAKIVLFARASNLQKAVEDIKKVARDATLITGYSLDFSDLVTIKKAVEQYKLNEGENAPITALINNAGVMACSYARTKDNFEMQMGTNHFGHFYLTQLLLPQLLNSKSRVVNVSSAAHGMCPVACTPETYTEQLNKETYTPWRAYSLSKTANIYFTIELQRRFGAQGLQAYSLHPGGVDTGLQRHVSLSQWFLTPLRFLLLKTQLEGTQTNLFCAVSDEAVPGKYHSDCHVDELANPYADNPERAREWWDYSEKIIDEKIRERRE